MEIDAFPEDFKSKKGKQKSYEVPHEPLTQAQIEQFMAQDVENISGIFGVDVSIVDPLILILAKCSYVISVNRSFPLIETRELGQG